VAEALFKGWKAAIQDMRTIMINARQAALNQQATL
jgi:pyridoxine 5-phosphate synthase